MSEPRLQVLALLRKAKKVDGEMFERAIRDFLETGPGALAGGKAGRRPRINDAVLELLLANVENARESGSEKAHLEQLAERGCRYGTGDGQVYYWFSVSTMKTHLRKARRLYETDKTFAERVDFLRWGLKAIHLSDG